ncbi:Tim44 domain-containing protein [Lacticaseibacillus suihuaensis]
MKKIYILLIVLLALAALPLTPTLARAGGATGGTTGGGTTGGGTTTGGTTTDRTNTRGYNNANTSPITVFASFIVLTGGLGVITYKRNHPSTGTARVRATTALDPEVEATFPALFDAMEAAWSANDQATLATLMTPRYFRSQKRLLDRWAKAGKCNRLEGMTIIALAQEPSRSGLHVVVTAQGRDWFEYPAESPAFNQQQHDDAMISRFTEVWELVAIDQVWRVKRIRQ